MFFICSIGHVGSNISTVSLSKTKLLVRKYFLIGNLGSEVNSTNHFSYLADIQEQNNWPEIPGSCFHGLGNATTCVNFQSCGKYPNRKVELIRFVKYSMVLTLRFFKTAFHIRDLVNVMITEFCFKKISSWYLLFICVHPGYRRTDIKVLVIAHFF